MFSFDFAGVEDILGESSEEGLLAEGETKVLQLPGKAALPVPDGGELVSELCRISAKAGPVGELVDAEFSPHLLRRL